MAAGGVIAFIVVIFACVGVYMLFFARDARIKRSMRAAPVVEVSEFPENSPAKIVGTLAHGDQTLIAPLSGRECTFFEAIVEEYRSNGKSGSWHQVVKEVRFADFLLEDASGRALIQLQGAEVVVVKDAHSKSGTFDDATELEQAFLDRHGRKSQGWVFNKKLRYKEGVLEQGEAIAVFGRGSWEADPDPAAVATNYRGTARRLVLRVVGETPLYVSDDPSTLR